MVINAWILFCKTCKSESFPVCQEGSTRSSWMSSSGPDSTPFTQRPWYTVIHIYDGIVATGWQHNTLLKRETEKWEKKERKRKYYDKENGESI